MERFDLKLKRYEYLASMMRAGAMADLLSTSVMIVSRSITVISLLIVAFGISPKLFLVLLVYVVAIMLLYSRKFRATWIDSHMVRSIDREVDYYKQSVLSPGIAKELRIYHNEDSIVEQWDHAYQKLMDFYRNKNRKQASLALVGAGGSYLCTATMMAFSIYAVAKGELQVDVFLMLYALGENLFSAFQSITVDLIEAGRGLLALGHQYYFTHQVPQNRRPSDLTAEEIAQADTVFEAKDISFSYDGLKNALDQTKFGIWPKNRSWTLLMLPALVTP